MTTAISVMKAETRILVCLHPGCEFSLFTVARETPEKCPGCRELGWWRVADDGEMTKSDRTLLRERRIKAE